MPRQLNHQVEVVVDRTTNKSAMVLDAAVAPNVAMTTTAMTTTAMTTTAMTTTAMTTMTAVEAIAMMLQPRHVEPSF